MCQCVYHFRYLSWKAVIRAALCWSHLPQLQSLELVNVDLRHHWQLQLMMQSLTAATTLTAISIHKLRTQQPVKLCGAIQALPNLKTLEFDSVPLSKGDALSLTRLTGLTSLAVANCSTAVDDVAAVAVCMHLSSLQRLKLSSQGLAGMGMLYPAAVGLKNLESLIISGRSSCCVDECCVGLLTGLTKLTQLSLSGSADVLSAAVQGLRRAVPGLTHVCITPTPALGSL